MPVPRETLWAIDEHTQAKHEILRRYLGAWFPILGSAHGRVLYVDGFSGPGRYRDGEPGSPLIALDAATERQHRRPFAGTLLFLFTDEREDRTVHLRSELAALAIPDNFRVQVEVGRFDEIFTPMLDDLEGEGHRLAPAFVFIDPFGFSGVPFSLVARILQNSHCEVFITFMANAVRRFLDHPLTSIREEIVRLFGTDRVLSILSGTGDRMGALRSLYQEQLASKAQFVRFFEIRHSPGSVFYYLFFASNNRLGHAKMKEAMWGVDPAGHFRFVDNTDVGQLILLDEDPVERLTKTLAGAFKGRTVLSGAVLDYTLNKTGFLEKHTRQALRALEQRGSVYVREEKQSGEKRRKGTFPRDAVVRFL